MADFSETSNLTIKDIANMCNVAVSTVSRALNNQPDINPATRKRILNVVKETGFVLNNSARNLKRSRSDCVAIIVNGLQNVFFTDMIKFVEESCLEQDYSTVLRHVDVRENELDVARSMIIEHNLIGIIFLGGDCDHPVDKLQTIKIPCVFCTFNVFNSKALDNYSVVCVDDYAQSKNLVNHLFNLGHKDIAIITDKSGKQNIGKLRLDGYLDAYKQHGLTPKKELQFYMDYTYNRYTMENGYAIANEIFDSGCMPSAIYAVSDLLAIGVCRAALDRGIKIPQELSVAGFDGIAFSKFFNPSLTTIEQPIELISKTATSILFDKLDGLKTPSHVDIAGKLIVGESTAKLNGE